jgi:hypothetical protein
MFAHRPNSDDDLARDAQTVRHLAVVHLPQLTVEVATLAA